MKKFFRNKSSGVVVLKREEITNGVLVSEFNPNTLIPYSDKKYLSLEELGSEWDIANVRPTGQVDEEIKKEVLLFVKSFIKKCFDHGLTEEDEDSFDSLRNERFIEHMLEDKTHKDFESFLRYFSSSNFPEDLASEIKYQDNILLGVLWDKRDDLKVLMSNISSRIK